MNGASDAARRRHLRVGARQGGDTLDLLYNIDDDGHDYPCDLLDLTTTL